MNDDNFVELKERLIHTFQIDNIDIKKMYDELLAFFSESIEDYIIRRQKEMRSDGYTNKEIYPLIKDEIKNYLFKGPNLTERQIKRIIYGD